MKCPESIEELQELEKNMPLCKVTLYEQAQARLKKNPEKSEFQAEKEIAEELDRPIATIHSAIQREKKNRSVAVQQLSPLNLTESNQAHGIGSLPKSGVPARLPVNHNRGGTRGYDKRHGL